jgi:hypothetical protein
MRSVVPIIALVVLHHTQLVAADRRLEDCEACGLLIWRMQTIVAKKAVALENLKKAKEKRAKKSTKAHSKRWLKQEYGVELAAAIEAEVDRLQSDERLLSACRHGPDAIAGSYLRGVRAQRTSANRGLQPELRVASARHSIIG